MARNPRTAVAAAKSNNLPVSSDIQAQVEAMIAGMQERVGAPGGDTIKCTKAKEFELPDGRTTSDPLSLIILDFVSYNAFYEGRYDPGNIAPPICFSIGTAVQQMVPSANASEPQCTTCAACPMNQFGSDGNGKACKNQRKLAVLPADFDDDTPLYILNVSPTGLKHYDKFVSTLASANRKVPAQIVTEVSFDEASEYQSLRFKVESPLDAETQVRVFARIDEARARLTTEPDMSRASTTPAAKPARGKAAPARRTTR